MDELLVVLHGGVGSAAIHVGGEKEIVGDNVGWNSGLGDEAVEGEEVSILGLAVLGSHYSIAGVHSGTTIGVN